jgi:hypothetical protein
VYQKIENKYLPIIIQNLYWFLKFYVNMFYYSRATKLINFVFTYICYHLFLCVKIFFFASSLSHRYRGITQRTLGSFRVSICAEKGENHGVLSHTLLETFCNEPSSSYKSNATFLHYNQGLIKKISIIVVILFSQCLGGTNNFIAYELKPMQ